MGGNDDGKVRRTPPSLDPVPDTGNKSDAAIYDEPSYRGSEAARLLALPISTVNAWCFGQAYKNSHGDSKRFQAIITPASARRRLLSFANLCELHILGTIRRHHRVTLPKVRSALKYVRNQLAIERPLLDQAFQTNGVALFVEHAGQLLNVSAAGQAAMRGEFEVALSRIHRNDSGQPVRLFPLSRPSSPSTTQPRVVAIDPRVGFGRPIVAPAGVRTEVIADRFAAGDSPAEMAEDYGVNESDILEALRFEQRLAA